MKTEITVKSEFKRSIKLTSEGSFESKYIKMFKEGLENMEVTKVNSMPSTGHPTTMGFIEIELTEIKDKAALPNFASELKGAGALISYIRAAVRRPGSPDLHIMVEDIGKMIDANGPLLDHLRLLGFLDKD